MPPPQQMTDPIESLSELLSLLDIERIEVNLFRGVSPDDGMKRVFGGQVIAQALVAAYRTVQDRTCHSLHAYFIRPGDPTVPILYEVDRARDGRSFATRRVVAIQHGEQIFNMACSFQSHEEGFEHQSGMPDAPPPEELPTEAEIRDMVKDKIPEQFAKQFARPRPIEMRPVDRQNVLSPKPMPPNKKIWMRARGEIGDDQAMQQCVLAYASDMGILDTAARPHGVSWVQGNVQMASLDHLMWFHRPFRFEDWLLYTTDAPSACGARGFNRGEVYTADGRLVASLAQEGLMRPVKPRPPKS